ncbi:MAG: alpha/beta family hydrolase [Hyphomicrobiales bacterium]
MASRSTPPDAPPLTSAQHIISRSKSRCCSCKGTRDALADTTLMETLVEKLGEGSTLRLFQDADHSFHVPAKTGRKDADVRTEMLGAMTAWLETIL